MKKWNILLIILLLVQAGLILISSTVNTDFEAITTDSPLCGFQTKLIDTVRIEGPKNENVRLKRSDGTWQLPEYYHAPADQKRVRQLLEKLHALKRDWPVATTTGAAKRFKVAPDDFERHILLYNGDNIEAELYVGTSPSFRKVHVRLPDSSEIMAVPFAVFDAGTSPENWLDKQMLKIDAADIKELRIGKLTLVRRDDVMVPARDKPNATVARDKVEQLVNRIADLQIGSIAGTKVLPDYGLATPTLTCTITLKDGSSRVWKFGKKKDGDGYVLQTSNHDLLFNIPSWKVKPLLEIKTDDLFSNDQNNQAVDSAAGKATEALSGKTAEAVPEAADAVKAASH